MVLLDSSFLVAYHNRRDVHHAAAAQIMEKIVAGEWGQALLLEYVFLEVVTVLLVRRGFTTATEVAMVLLGASEVEFVPCSAVFLETLETFRNQASGRLSFADAAIVTVARRRGVSAVATFDTDFRGIEGIDVIPA